MKIVLDDVHFRLFISKNKHLKKETTNNNKHTAQKQCTELKLLPAF